MAKKSSKSNKNQILGFNLTDQSWSDDIQWQTPNAFSFSNIQQVMSIGPWPIDILAFNTSSRSKEVLIILLGPLESVRVYKYLVTALLPERSIVFVSLPGFGMNMSVDIASEEIELKSFSVFVEALFDVPALQDKTLHLMGSSAAASIALEASLRVPERVASLIVNGLTHKPSKIWQLLFKEVTHRLSSDNYLDCADAALLYLVSDEILGRGRTWGVFRQYFRKKIGELDSLQKNCLRKVVQMILKGDGLNEDHLTNTPKCPVLAFTGEYDHLSSPYDHAHFIDACINGQFATLDDADHMVHVERPRVVARLVPGFLNQINLDTIDSLRTYPPQSYVTLDRRRDPRYVTSRPKIQLKTQFVQVPEDWEDPIPQILSAKLRNINFSGCLIQLHDERFQIQPHAEDVTIYLPRLKLTLKVLAFEQVNKSLRCLFLHENYETAMAFKEMLDFGEHFVDADLELDEFESEPKEMPWLGAKRQGGGVY